MPISGYPNIDENKVSLFIDIDNLEPIHYSKIIKGPKTRPGLLKLFCWTSADKTRVTAEDHNPVFKIQISSHPHLDNEFFICEFFTFCAQTILCLLILKLYKCIIFLFVPILKYCFKNVNPSETKCKKIEKTYKKLSKNCVVLKKKCFKLDCQSNFEAKTAVISMSNNGLKDQFHHRIGAKSVPLKLFLTIKKT